MTRYRRWRRRDGEVSRYKRWIRRAGAVGVVVGVLWLIVSTVIGTTSKNVFCGTSDTAPCPPVQSVISPITTPASPITTPASPTTNQNPSGSSFGFFQLERQYHLADDLTSPAQVSGAVPSYSETRALAARAAIDIRSFDQAIRKLDWGMTPASGDVEDLTTKGDRLATMIEALPASDAHPDPNSEGNLQATQEASVAFVEEGKTVEHDLSIVGAFSPSRPPAPSVP